MDVRPSLQEDKGERGGQVHGCPRLHRKDREQSQQRGTGLVGGGQQWRCDCEMEAASDCEVDEATDREMEEANDHEARYDESGGDNMARGQGQCVGLPC